VLAQQRALAERAPREQEPASVPRVVPREQEPASVPRVVPREQEPASVRALRFAQARFD
jgi:hypothetical protein